MTQEQLRDRVRALLDLESSPVVDWEAVEARCAELSVDIERMPTEEVPDLLWHFVHDADIRRKDPGYGDWQRSELWVYVDTGEMVEHAPSVAISPWSCLALIAAAPLAALIWWLS